jgi:hypothetical protein
MKKNLRSGEGHTVESHASDSNRLYLRYHTGAHLYTITLYYCATPGLIAVGVLPKPPLWDYHRMVKPANTTAEEKEKLDKVVVSVKHNRKGNEILELNESDDSDSDTYEDMENDQNSDQALSKHKRPRIELSNGAILL